MVSVRRWLPWGLFVLAIVMAAADLIVGLQNDQVLGGHHGLTDHLVRVAGAVEPFAFTLVGAFILSRRPGNRIGWLMIAVGLAFALGGFTSDYPSEGRHVIRPLGPVAALISQVDWTFPLATLLVLVLLFPTGELPGRRWKPVLWIGLASFGIDSLLAALQKGKAGGTFVDNPIGLASIPEGILGIVGVFGFAALFAALLSLLLRFRSAQGNVRQQLKWFIYGTVMAVTLQVAAFMTSWENALLVVLALTATAFLPIFMGIAILRYRLYDIDVLINRTLVYGSFTVSLAALYIGAVIVLQALFSAFVGQGSDVAIAISTLAVASVFNPWRHRVQAFIDRRFYRRKYDAAHVISAFQGKLRDEVDLDQLSRELLAVVHETVQPAQVSIWLR